MINCHIPQEEELNLPQEVFIVPGFDDVKRRNRHNVSMHFPSKDLCVLSDGAGMLYIVNTGDRSMDDGYRWKVSSVILQFQIKQLYSVSS